MKPGKYFLEKSLTDNLNNAVQRTVKHPCRNDPFGAELKQAMQSFAFTLPASLQHDRITVRETLPFRREVTVTSIPAQQKAKTHPLISEVKEGTIVLTQPIMYVVKKGDTLSEISWRLTGRKASIRNLRNWNRISGDVIRPGQALWLADPNDGLVKAACESHSKSELTSRNPKISLDRLSPKMVARHGGLFTGQYQVEIKLEYRKPWEEFLNPELIGHRPESEIPWAPGFSGDNSLGNFYEDQPQYPDDVRLSGGDFWKMKSTKHDQGITEDIFKDLKTVGSVIRGGASVAKIVEAEYLAQATINNAIKGSKNVPVPNALKTIAKISKIGGYTGIAASWGIAGSEFYSGTDNTSTWVNAGISTIILGSGIVAITLGAPLLATAAGVAGVIYGVTYLFYGDKIDAYIDVNFGYR